MISLKLALIFYTLIGLVSSQDYSFIYNGFSSANLILDGMAEFTSNGLLKLSDSTKQGIIRNGHAFFPIPINSFNTSPFSFSTTFVFAIQPEIPPLSGHGIVFVISPNRGLPGALSSQFLGLFNNTNNGNSTNHVVAVELDTIQNNEFSDINDNHVGIDINGLISKAAEPAGYYPDSAGSVQNLTLISGKPMQVWVDYNGVAKQMNVTLAPINIAAKPVKPLLSFSYDLSSIINQPMYVGFSSSTGTLRIRTYHNILGWSFKMNGVADPLHLSKLPRLPRLGTKPTSKFLTICLPVILIMSFSIVVSVIIYHVTKQRKFAEELEDWEQEYGPHRFKYKDLYVATEGFRDKRLLGTGGFGRVYRGVMSTSKMEIAVKKVSHESKQGMKEFIAEIVSIGRMSHRNLVSLLGYCRRRGELLLVYDYMPNGSLDKYLYNQPVHSLNWNQRFRVIKDVASGLFYLHEKWEQVVIHRDVKASNVLLDGDFNARLGDFGLARLYDHGSDPQTTHVVGTFGYLAPEHSRTGKATTSTDVFAFGAFMLEVACGRRPVELRSPEDDLILVEWVYSCYKKGTILEAVDTKLEFDYVKREVELVMKLALLCLNSDPKARPSMRQVLLYLEGALALPVFLCLEISATGLTSTIHEGCSDVAMSSYSSSMEKTFSHSSSVAESLLSGGR